MSTSKNSVSLLLLLLPLLCVLLLEGCCLCASSLTSCLGDVMTQVISESWCLTLLRLRVLLVAADVVFTVARKILAFVKSIFFVVLVDTCVDFMTGGRLLGHSVFLYVRYARSWCDSYILYHIV